MKTLIFSDTHFDTQFEPARYKAIIRLIEKVDRVIINGDFWDSFLCTFDEFVNSKWQEMFLLLKKKQAIYIYGNHDRARNCDKRVSLFSVKQAENLSFVMNNQTYLVQHGHTLAPEFEERHPVITRMFKDLYPWLDASNDGTGIIGSIYKKITQANHRHLWKAMVNNLTANVNWQATGKQLIVGHCHLQLKDQVQRVQSLGSFRWGWARYGIVDDQGLKVFEERYN